MRHTTFLLAFFLLPRITFSQVDHWESVVKEGNVFRYLEPVTQPSTLWTQLNFDDSNWDQGVSGFGYGDGDDNTAITNPSITVYLRKSFVILDLSSIEQVIFHMDYDDGFVAYLNDVEIARDLVSGSPPGFDQPADGLHEASLYNGLPPEEYTIDKSLLVQGNNMLAVEVHNESTTSSDMTANPFLSLGINNQSFNYNTLPFWFSAPVFVDFTSTSLPLVVIETNNGFTIPDEPKVEGRMSIINRVDGQPNSLADVNDPAALDYTGLIQIETRGSSSQALPKKSYGFTTYDASGSDKDNVSLLGMPVENDWILNSLAFDSSLLRDNLSYSLANSLGEYASRTKYCEVFINHEYQGLYMLQEKLKADNDRININRIEPEDNELPKLSGGYITKADKTTGDDPIAWTMSGNGGGTANFIHDFPKPEEVTVEQNDYIQSIFHALEDATLSNNNSVVDGLPSIIDIRSFVNHIIINELAANRDAYRLSTYFHKDRNAKLRAGPVWDFNLTYGNNDKSLIDEFKIETKGPAFWRLLFKNPEFHCRLSTRWAELRQPGQPLHLNEIFQKIDESILTFEEAIIREEATWGRIGDHNSKIEEMKAWISSRLDWMDEGLAPISSCSSPLLPELIISKIHYHPSSNIYDEDDLEFIEITNNGTVQVDLTGIYFGGTGLVYQFPIGASIAAGEQIMLANDAETFEEAYEAVPFGEFSRNLSNSGRSIELLDGWGNQIDIVSYTDNSPWPEEADGNGLFLELSNLNSDNSLAENWTAAPMGLITSINNVSTTQIYPNPSNDYLIIQSESVISELRILDINGRLLDKMTPTRDTYYYNTELLPVGIYLLLIQNTRGWEQQRIIIQK